MSTPTIFALSTQVLPDALVEQAASKGIQLDTIAFIRTEVLETGDLPQGPAIAVFTSQHAVEALPKGAGSEWKIFCIEGATRRLAAKRFGGSNIVGTAPSAGELAEVITAAGAGKEVTFFCGDRRLDDLPERLRRSGIPVEERIVYRTLQTPHRLEREYAAIAFFSPSAVESLFSVNEVSEKTVLFAIGRTTAAAIFAQTGRLAMIGSRPDKEILIQEMIAYFFV